MTAPSVAAPHRRASLRAHTGAKVMAVVAWAAFLVGAIICLWLLLDELHDVVGPQAFFYGVMFAVAPTPFLAAGFVLLDRRGPVSTQLVVISLVWGSCVATLIALKLNEFAVARLAEDGTQGVRGAVFVAPWVEEAAKGLILFGIVWWQRERFVTPIGAAIYGALVGVGFAFTENVVYYSSVFEHSWATQGDRGAALDAVAQLFWWRGIAAPFVHPVFTLTTGLGLGLALRQRHLGARLLAPVAGYLGAVLLHTGYNVLASYAADRALKAVYIGILLPILVSAVIALLLIRRQDRRVLGARLDDYVFHGWLRQWQSDAIATSRGRRLLIRDAARYGSRAKRSAYAWIATGTELGAVRDRIVRGIATDDDLRAEPRLLDAVRGVAPEPTPMPAPTASPTGAASSQTMSDPAAQPDLAPADAGAVPTAT